MRVVYRALAALVLAAATPAHAAWHEARTRHFIIYSDDSPLRISRFAERLEKFDKAVRLVRGMDDPPLTDARRLTIYMLPSGYAVGRLIGRSNALGMYLARASGSYAFVPRRSAGDAEGLDVETIFFHEYAHHLQLQQANRAIPAWYTEGFAEFFATADIKDDGSVLIGSVPKYRLWALNNEASGLSMEQMVAGAYAQLTMEQLDRLYGRGWLLTHYLTFEPSRKGQLARYLAAIHAGMDPLQAAGAAFGDLKALDSDITRYGRRRLTAVEVNSKALEVEPAQVRPLSQGAAAIMNIHIRSTRGVDEKTAAGLVVEARKIASKYPNDPFVQAALAEAEYDVSNFAAADAAADRALAARPDHVRALIYKGRAQLQLALANRAQADWAGIRRWFLKANKADTEHAEPLMLFYRSFLEAGQHPTRNAINGLIYAVDLAPQDDELRLTAMSQLLTEGKIAEAKRMFAPIAFNAHATEKQRAEVAKVNEAFARGDGPAVLALLKDFADEDEEEAGR